MTFDSTCEINLFPLKCEAGIMMFMRGLKDEWKYVCTFQKNE